jgi:hypothetical protein
VGCSRTAIMKLMRNAGVEAPAAPVPAAMPDARWARRVDDGATVLELAEYLGQPVSTIEERLAAIGLLDRARINAVRKERGRRSSAT